MPFLEHIIENHRYLPYIVLLAWTFLEGETIVILAGIAAKDGDMSLPWIIICAFCGSLCSDQLVFFLARRHGKAFVARRPRWQQRAEKVHRLLEAHQTWLILGFRFLYGLRNITPLALGMGGVCLRRFLILNMIGAALWAATFACGGYLFGTAMERWVGKQRMVWVLLVILGVATICWAARWLRSIINRQDAAHRPSDPADRVKTQDMEKGS